MKIPWKYWILAAVIITINVVIYATQVGGPEVLAWSSTLLPVICAAAGAVALLKGIMSFGVWDSPKIAWMAIWVGIAASGTAEGIYLVLKMILGIDVDSIVPSLADIFWMIGYLPILAGFIMFINGYRKSGLPVGNGMKFLPAFIIAFAIAAGLILWVFSPIFEDPETEWIAKAVYFYYPLFDFFVLIPAGILILITTQFRKGLLSIPWKLLALAILCWAAADIAYSMLSWQDLYNEGNFIDLLWNASYLLVGAAGLYQKALLRSV
ncbi:MAG: hypothetical protein EHM28_13835 [Spirochaetaceae bacterium]|nr:MAG: hypothetical protein EHM28_13835 [Spirochaetaceae bacterium]